MGLFSRSNLARSQPRLGILEGCGKEGRYSSICLSVMAGCLVSSSCCCSLFGAAGDALWRAICTALSANSIFCLRADSSRISLLVCVFEIGSPVFSALSIASVSAVIFAPSFANPLPSSASLASASISLTSLCLSRSRSTSFCSSVSAPISSCSISTAARSATELAF